MWNHPTSRQFFWPSCQKWACLSLGQLSLNHWAAVWILLEQTCTFCILTHKTVRIQLFLTMKNVSQTSLPGVCPIQTHKPVLISRVPQSHPWLYPAPARGQSQKWECLLVQIRLKWESKATWKYSWHNLYGLFLITTEQRMAAVCALK